MHILFYTKCDLNQQQHSLPGIYHSICGLFLYRQTAAIRITLPYVWSITMTKNGGYPKYFILCVSICTAKDRQFAESCSPRL